MTNGQNFKKGDIVRLKSKDQLPDWLKNSSGQIAEVAAYFPDEDRYSMKFGNEYHPMKGEYFEPCPRDIYMAQRRTAFLRKLGALLKEFDAAIEPEYSSYSEVGIVSIIVGSECIVESYDTITADNIMDFDKS